MSKREEDRANAVKDLVFTDVWRAVVLVDVVTEGEQAGAILFAVETAASILRRRARDCGVPKDAVEGIRKDASEAAEHIYEGSGVGRDIRAAKAKHDEARAKDDVPPDSAYTPDQVNEAQRIAAEAIRRITLNKDT